METVVEARGAEARAGAEMVAAARVVVQAAARVVEVTAAAMAAAAATAARARVAEGSAASTGVVRVAPRAASSLQTGGGPPGSGGRLPSP